MNKLVIEGKEIELSKETVKNLKKLFETERYRDSDVVLKGGDRIYIAGDEYLVAQVDRRKMACVSLVDGNRWSKPIVIQNYSRITLAEFKKYMKDTSGLGGIEEILETKNQ